MTEQDGNRSQTVVIGAAEGMRFDQPLQGA